MSITHNSLRNPPGADERRAVPQLRTNLAASSAAFALGLAAETTLVAALISFDRSLGVDGARLVTARVICALLALAGASTVFYGGRALTRSLRARRLGAAGDLPAARIAAEDARTDVSYNVGIVLAVLIVAFLAWFISTNDAKIRTTFMNWSLIWQGRRALWHGFWLNIKLFMVAQVLVMVWALIVAVVRQLPGRGAAPVRWLSIAYTDVFRGVPAVIVIFMVVIGLPTAGVPPFANWADKDAQRFWLAVLALVLVYGSYVAEVYRAGLESIHWSQVAAARSLGLSQFQTLRHVVVPQAVRRIIPPLLNDFIALQKDTALVAFAGLLDVLGQANLLKSKYFNLSPVLGAGLMFLVITIPLTRFTDYLLKREKQRMMAG